MGEPTDARASEAEESRGRLSRSVLEAVRRREGDALGELFDLHFDRLFGLAYRLLGDHPAAQEVVQEVFLKVYKAAHQIDPDRDPGPWLMRITHNACREYWRKRGRKLEKHSHSLDADVALRKTMADEHPDPERAMLSTQRETLVQDALMALREPLRSVVVLYDVAGMSHKEIAAFLGTSETAVRKRYSRALGRLRTDLKDALD
jgi:RNA polymerase sigma-70 factor (ECF subfamily)